MSASDTPEHAQTKIVATIGPASSPPAVLKDLVQAGVDVFRLNFSHGSHTDHKAVFDSDRALEHELGKAIGVLADLQGPKLRLGVFADGAVDLEIGQTFRFDLDDTPGDNTRVQLPHPEILNVLEEGGRIFLDDGKVRAKITKTSNDHVEAIIEAGAKLSDKKGLNVPGALIPIPALTEKDKADLAYALEIGVDWIAQSFVQTPQDVQDALDIIQGRAKLMVKLEKPAALDNLDTILALCDGVMVARGDLGVEIAPEKVPSAQKRIIRKARELGKPVVVATQMLESMITNARPTRAEASDVATAVYDGADAVMLSAETAVGDYPMRAVTIMNRVCHYTEQDETYEVMMEASHPETERDASDAITTAALLCEPGCEREGDCHLYDVRVYSIAHGAATPNHSHYMLYAGRDRRTPAECLFGIEAIYAPEIEGDFSGPTLLANQILIDHGFAQKGDQFVMTAGVPFGTPGSTNLLRIADVE